MRQDINIRKHYMSVDFMTNFYQRSATFILPFTPDDIILVRPLWIDYIPHLMFMSYGDVIVLRWFETSETTLMPVVTLPIEVHYTSKQLDREDKLELLGVKL